MKRFAVELTEGVLAAISAQARYIAVDQRQPVNAERWLRIVWEAVDSLEQFPRRCALAEENDDVDYEVRQILVGSPSLLFTIDEERETVWVIALRGEGQLPRPESLPSSHDALEMERRIEALRRALHSGDSALEAAALADLEAILRKRLRNAGGGRVSPRTVQEILKQVKDELDDESG